MTELWNFFSREKSDRQYTPTLWTRRLPSDQLLPKHIELTQTESRKYREASKHRQRNLSFGEGEFRGEIDVFDGGGERAPIVVYIHGGWWQWFSKDQFSFLAEPFNKRGFTVHLPGYRLAQDWSNGRPMESIVKQMELAVAETLREACRTDAPAVYLMGHSAGGHLVTMLHQTDWGPYDLPAGAAQKIKGVFSLAGLFDIRFLLGNFVNDAIKMTYESAVAVSPQLRASTRGALSPLHLILPEYDTAEFFRQTKEYQNKLLEEGHECHLHVASRRDHLNLVECLADEDDALFAYLIAHMGGERAPS